MTQSGKRPPRPGELSSYDLARLSPWHTWGTLYRAACRKLARAGHWSRAPLASEWACIKHTRCTLSDELCGRGHHADCLRIEQEVRDTEPVGAPGQRQRWEV